MTHDTSLRKGQKASTFKGVNPERDIVPTGGMNLHAYLSPAYIEALMLMYPGLSASKAMKQYIVDHIEISKLEIR